MAEGTAEGTAGGAAEGDRDRARERWARVQRSYAKFVARYRTDQRFRAEADRDPGSALSRAGVPVEPGVRVRLVPVDRDELLVPILTKDVTWDETAITYGCFYTFGCLGSVGCVNGCMGTAACFGTAGTLDISCIATPGDPPKDPDPEDPEEPEEPEEPGDGGDTGVLRSRGAAAGRAAVDPTSQRWADARRAYAKFVARYRTDARFRAAAERDPAEALRRSRIPVEPGTRVRLVTVDPDERLVLLPTTSKDLEQVLAQGGTFGTAGSLGTAGTVDGSIFCFACFFTFGCSGLTLKSPEDPKEPEEPEDPEEPESPEEPEGEDTGRGGRL